MDEEAPLTDSSKNSTIFQESRECSVDPRIARFPHCVVWTPLPIVSWLSPFIGHVGICREDGVILDFAGPYFINVGNFAFGSPAKYVRLDPQECCFPTNLSAHTCKDGFNHSQRGTSTGWDDALRTCMHKFQHKAYNFFTCNCHSFVSTCLNRAAYEGCITWNIIKLLVLVHSCRGRWVNPTAVVKSFAPFVVVMGGGIWMAGLPFVMGWILISFLFLAWFVLATYCFNGLVDC